jgi:hypothetical protein
MGHSARRATASAAKLAVFSSALFMAISFAAPVAQAQSIDDSQGGAVELGSGPVSNTGSGSVSESPATGTGAPRVGRKAAEKYLSPNAKQDRSAESRHGSSEAEHFLGVHIGGYVSDTAYNWGSPNVQNNVGKLTLGLTYKVGEWVNSMDLSMRVDFSSYSLNDGSASKISFLPLITFPDVKSRFPLYFGVGAGLGVFATQFDGKSPLSLDYQVVAGARFFDVLNSTGFFIEAGLKDHLLLLSSGQFNGTFVALGAIFLF